MVLKLTNILQDQKVFRRIKGITIKDESVRQRTVELFNEGMANLDVTIYNGTSA